MSINWPAWIAAMDDPSKSKVVGKIGFIPMPAERAPAWANWARGCSPYPPHRSTRADAFDFLYWATDAPQMKQAALRGNPPTRRSVFRIAGADREIPRVPGAACVARIGASAAAHAAVERDRERVRHLSFESQRRRPWTRPRRCRTPPARSAQIVQARHNEGPPHSGGIAVGRCRPLLVLLALSIYPLIYSVKVSLTNSAGAFALDNFTRLFEDRVFAVAGDADRRYSPPSR